MCLWENHRSLNGKETFLCSPHSSRFRLEEDWEKLSSHLFHNRDGRWDVTDDFTTSFLLFFSVLHCPLGFGELQACPFPDAVFPPLLLSAMSSSPFHCALQDGFGQT